MHPFALTLVSGILLGIWVLLLRFEAYRDQRVAPRVRGFLDHTVLAFGDWVHRHAPEFNREYVRQLFHYSVHQGLSLVLAALSFLERGIKRIVHINRSRARTAREPRTDSHLSHVLAHKETVALSEEEKTERKEKALRGGRL